VKNIIAAAVVITMAASPAAAGPIQDASKRAAVNQGQGQFEPPRNSGGGKGMLWSGIGLAAGGATLGILGATALKKEGDEFDLCMYFLDDESDCSDAKETNKPLVWSGVAAAGVGATLAIIGARNSSFQLVRGGFVAKHRVKF
jgi:hypothetical protein